MEIRELISKKDLLEVTGISYGQLYRWKRKKLIPEDWFIKKASFTGQETFFPKEKILDRVEKIKNMKDEISLDDLAQMFSPNLENITLNGEQIIKKKIVTQNTLNIYIKYNPECKKYNFDEMLYMCILEKCLMSGTVSIDESEVILNTLKSNYKKIESKVCKFIIIKKMGISIYILVSVPYEMYFDEFTKVILKINILECIEQLKMKVNVV